MMNLLCARVGSIAHVGPRKDTQLDECSACHHAVWINPESRARMEPGDRIQCLECFERMRQLFPGVRFYSIEIP